MNFLNTFERAWSASFSDFVQAGIEPTIAQEIVKKRSEIDLDKEMANIEKAEIRLVTIEDEEYPELLKEIYNPPFLLFVRGQINPADKYAVAIVGARRASEYGKQVTANLAMTLAQNNVTIVSGLALGIDSYAHQATLSVPNARTIAVLGCGIDDDSIYPSENKGLAHKIIEGRGAVISEFGPGMPPLKQHFPARNRIISGLSLGVVVVEATLVSGSLITARHALEQGRDVFAVPGNIYHKNAEGPNSLIKTGAKLVEKPEDILEELHLKQVAEKMTVQRMLPETDEEQNILKHLELEPIHVDKLVELVGVSVTDINSLLVMMEMKGIVRNLGGGNYIASK